MQGILTPIPTAKKIRYLNALLRVGFHTLDFGSFVSPKAIPQLADTPEVLAGLDLSTTHTRLLAIVANLRGAETAAQYPAIHDIGYPFSVSETFQQRNTQRSVADSLILVQELQEVCIRSGKSLVVYLSMAFGNPYGDPWSPEIVEQWADTLAGYGIRTLALADTVGSSTPETIVHLLGTLMSRLPEIQWGAHFHARPEDRQAKLAAAWDQGCRRFDTALNGYGGCPFAKDELVGNISTESFITFCAGRGVKLALDEAAWTEAQALAAEVFG
jgi:hydroxymethylglutaryl-CoA lyase